MLLETYHSSELNMKMLVTYTLKRWILDKYINWLSMSTKSSKAD